MTKITGETPPKCTLTEKDLASRVKLMQCPKVMGSLSFSNHCLEEITLLFTFHGMWHHFTSSCTAQEIHKSNLHTCAYLLCHTALTTRLNYQNQKVVAAVWKRKVSLKWKRIPYAVLFPREESCIHMIILMIYGMLNHFLGHWSLMWLFPTTPL